MLEQQVLLSLWAAAKQTGSGFISPALVVHSNSLVRELKAGLLETLSPWKPFSRRMETKNCATSSLNEAFFNITYSELNDKGLGISLLPIHFSR